MPQPPKTDATNTWSLEQMHSRLRDSAAQIKADPLTNSVFVLARELFFDLQSGQTDLDAIEALSQDVF